MRQLKTIVVLLLVIIALTAAYQNITPIKGKAITLGLDLYLAKWETPPIPLGFVIVMCLLGGALIMAFVDVPVLFRLRKRVRELEKDLARYRPSDAVEAFEVPGESDKEAADEPKGT